MRTSKIDEMLARLLDAEVQQILLNGGSDQIVAALNGKRIPQVATQTTSTISVTPPITGSRVVGTFTIRTSMAYTPVLVPF